MSAPAKAIPARNRDVPGVKMRINLLGASGAGVSTLGRALAARLSVPHWDSDDFYHAPSDPPFQVQRTPHERCELLTQACPANGAWVLSGGVVGWEPVPRLGVTHLVFVLTPTTIRLERLRQRERERFGERVLAGGDMFEIHQDFIAWAARYDAGDVDGKTRARHEEYLRTQRMPVIRCNGDLPIADNVAALLTWLGMASGVSSEGEV